MPEALHILQISPRIPWPVTDGSAIGIYNITRSVAARGHRVVFVAFGERGGAGRSGEERGGATRPFPPLSTPIRPSPASEASTAPIRPYPPLPAFCELIVVPHDTSNSPLRVFKNLFSRDPYPISKYDCPAMFAALDELCASRRFDVVHVDHAHMAMYGEYVSRKYGLPYVLREHNFETTIYRRYVEQARLPIVKQYWALQARRLYRYETRAVSIPDVVAAITPEDASQIRAAVAERRGTERSGEERGGAARLAPPLSAPLRPSPSLPDNRGYSRRRGLCPHPSIRHAPGRPPHRHRGTAGLGAERGRGDMVR